MQAIHRRLFLGLAILLALTAPSGHAQQFERFGDVEAHYSAISTTFIPREVADRLGVMRSQAQGLVTLTVRDAAGETLNVPVDGTVAVVGESGESPLAFRRLDTGGGVSRIATFPLTTSAPMRFRLALQLDRNAAPETLSFMQRFHRDD